MNDNDTNEQAEFEAEFKKALEGKTNDEIIELFIEGLLLEKWQDEDISDVHDDLAEDLTNRLNLKLNENLVNALPASKVVELDDMIERGEASPENVRDLLMQAGVDVDELMKNTMDEFRNEYLAEGTDEVEE